MRIPTSTVIVFNCALLALIQISHAQDWTRFRGPNGHGISHATTVPAKWTEADFNWKTKLPGIGHSSPVVWGHKVFLLSANPENATRYLLCIDALSGKTLWTREYPSETHHLHKFSSYASCTPAVDKDQVYVAWSTPKETTLKALDHDGNETWSLDLGRWVSQHGFGTSPMLYGDMVILHNSQDANQLPEGVEPGKSFVHAFDRKSGEEIWRTPLVSVNVCYSVPCVYTPSGGVDELLCASGGNGIFSLDPRTGKMNWSIDGLFSMRVVSCPIVAGGLVFGSTGSGGGGNYVVAATPGKNGKLAYEIKTQAPYVPTMVARGDLMFLWYDKGIVTCIDAPTGEMHWRERIGGNFFGSPVIVNDRVYCISDAGDVVVLKAADQFELLARNPLGEPSQATPAISGGRMYLRTVSHLISVGGKSL